MDVADQEVVIAIVNYNGRDLLETTIESALAMDHPRKRLLVVDDGSTDGSVAYLRERYPEVPVIEMGRNTAMVSRVRNTALRAANCDFVLLTDNDIQFDRQCLTRLLEAARAHDAAVLVPRVMFRHDPQRIYIDHNEFHYVCSSIDRKRNRTLEELGEEAESCEVVRTFGCGINLIDTRKAAQVGFFDDDFQWGWGDDGELHHRINLAGLRCLSVPSAIIYHEAIKGRPRIHAQVHNRLSMVIQTYAARSLLVLAPALLLYDACLFGFLALRGQGGEYVGAVRDVLRSRSALLEKRRRVQASRRVRDRELFSSGEFYVPDAYVSGVAAAALRVLNVLFNAYWRLARPLVG